MIDPLHSLGLPDVARHRSGIRAFARTTLILLIAGVLLAGASFFLWNQNRGLESEMAILREEAREAQTLREAQKDVESLRVQVAELDRLRKDNQELLRLRNEARQFREQKEQLTKLGAETEQLRAHLQQLQQQNRQLAVQAQQRPEPPVPTPPPLPQAGVITVDTAQANACLNNLRVLHAAIEQWALENRKTPQTQVTGNDLGPYLQTVPVCPAGGIYSLSQASHPPQCSVPGHALP